ncbi:thrombospondin type 1 domain protein [Ostertagia ostertagi]
MIDTNPSKSFYVGPYDRTRIDLVEQGTTSRIEKEGCWRKISQKRANDWEASSIDAESRDDSEVFTETSTFPQRLVFGEWSHWTEWTPCMNGERSRIRACSSKRPALRIVCHGEAKEVQRCFSMVEAHIPVAEDPWSIEREISGNFKI